MPYPNLTGRRSAPTATEITMFGIASAPNAGSSPSRSANPTGASIMSQRPMTQERANVAAAHTTQQGNKEQRTKHSSSKVRGGYRSDASSRSGRSDHSRDYYRNRKGDGKTKKYTGSGSNRNYKQYVAKWKDSDAESVQSKSSAGSAKSHQKH